MKYIITESKLEDAILSWMDKKFDPNTLEKTTLPKAIYLKKNGTILMGLDLEKKIFWFDYDEIWSILDKFFKLNDNEIESILKKWLERHDLKGLKPGVGYLSFKRKN
jgi:oligoribonuclease NrnB/cAMP/cGMP phosphodiesterase (DHH superfamily)